MSDYIPVEILAEIFKRVPVKSLIRFRLVSKPWRSLIDSPEFINSYQMSEAKPQNHHIYVQFKLCGYRFYKCIMDKYGASLILSSLTVPLPLILLGHPSPLSCVSGLLCFYDKRQDLEVETMMAVLWNPTVRKSVGIAVPNVLHLPEGLTFIGFGVCPNTSDPKLVKINTLGFRTVDWEVEVFKLSTRVWKTVSNIPPAFRSCDLTWESQVCVGGFIYMLAYDDVKLIHGVRSNLIVAFDLKSDEFGGVCLPDRLVHMYDLRVTEIKESLGLIENYYYSDVRDIWTIWIMKEGVTKSFALMFSIRVPQWMDDNVILGFTKDDGMLLKYTNDDDDDDDDDDDELSFVLSVVADPYIGGSQNSVGIPGCVASFSAKSYMETLLLLDQSNSFIY